MSILDAQDRAVLVEAGTRIAQALILVACFVVGVLLCAGTAGLAWQLFRFTSGW